MTAKEKFTAKLNEVRRKRREHDAEIADQLDQLKAINIAAEEEAAALISTPSKIEEYLSARGRADGSLKEMSALLAQVAEDEARKKPVVTPQETAAVLEAWKHDLQEEVLPLAEEMLSLRIRMFEISKQIINISRLYYNGIQAWKIEADPTTSDITGLLGLPGVWNFARLYNDCASGVSLDEKVSDNVAATYRSDIECLKRSIEQKE